MALPRAALAEAVRAGDFARVRSSIAAGADVNFQTSFRSPLAWAAAANQREIAEYLINCGATVSWCSTSEGPFDGWSALTFADAEDHHKLADRLIELGVPAETRNAHGYAELHRAARRADVTACRRLLAVETANVDPVDAAGRTPLQLAIAARNEECARVLLEAGADPNHIAQDWSVLAEAACQDSMRDGSTSFVKLLIRAGADPNPPGYPPLLAAVNQDGSSAAVLRQLVTAGSRMDLARDHQGETVLHRIAGIADWRLVDTAVTLGAEMEPRDNRGLTPLLSAAAAGNLSTFKRLIRHGADLNARDNDGRGLHAITGSHEEARLRKHLGAVLRLRADNLVHP